MAEISKTIKVVKETEFDKSAKRAEELRAGRAINDIPLNDPYWAEANKHRLEHNK